jgi:hypothetical protein
MGSEHWPIIVIEVVLGFGGALLFGWWQLRTIKRDRAKAAAERAAAQREGGTASPQEKTE